MAGLMDIVILAIPVGLAVAYFNECFGYCPGAKKTIDDFIATIIPPPASAYTSRFSGITDYRAYRASSGEIQENLPTDWEGATVDPVIHPVMSGRDRISFRNQKNVGISNSVRTRPGGFGGLGY